MTMKTYITLMIKAIPVRVWVVAIIILLPSISALAQIDLDDNDVPIDGGLSLLVAAGVGYGAKQLKKKKYSTNRKA